MNANVGIVASGFFGLRLQFFFTPRSNKTASDLRYIEIITSTFAISEASLRHICSPYQRQQAVRGGSSLQHFCDTVIRVVTYVYVRICSLYCSVGRLRCVNRNKRKHVSENTTVPVSSSASCLPYKTSIFALMQTFAAILKCCCLQLGRNVFSCRPRVVEIPRYV